jgi:hypothetical protein
MKVVQLGLAGFLFLITACATSVGKWEGGSKTENAAALRVEVRESLTGSGWGIIEDVGPKMVAVKAAEGGQRTLAEFSFADAAPGSTFTMSGGSHHRFNWATFGILGLTMRNKAGVALIEWYDAWVSKHPKS